MYSNLNAGNYILRIVAKSENGERAVIRRAIRIGIIIRMYHAAGYCRLWLLSNPCYYILIKVPAPLVRSTHIHVLLPHNIKHVIENDYSVV